MKWKGTVSGVALLICTQILLLLVESSPESIDFYLHSAQQQQM